MGESVDPAPLAVMARGAGPVAGVTLIFASGALTRQRPGVAGCCPAAPVVLFAAAAWPAVETMNASAVAKAATADLGRAEPRI